MPELPEVETIRGGLERTIVGLRITEVEVLSEKNFQGDKKDIIGGVVKSIDRRAKILIIKIAASRQKSEVSYLLIHLKMTGQLVYRQESKVPTSALGASHRLIQPCLPRDASAGRQSSKFKKFKKSPYNIDGLPNKYTRVIIAFDNGSRLYFNDLRRFGWLKIVKDLDDIIGDKFGPEPFDKEFTINYLKDILSRWGRPVKLLLMDQKRIAGIGNIYANEALFCARIAPHHRGKELTKDHPEKVEKLYYCIKKILREAIKYGGSTASDDAYRNIKGGKGRMQEKLKVYGRAGEKCFQCGKTIKRMTLGGRGTFFCPACQR